jgi:hypothetical protein
LDIPITYRPIISIPSQGEELFDLTPNHSKEPPLLAKERDGERSEPSTKLFKKLKPPTFRPLPPTYEYALRWINLSSPSQGKGLVDRALSIFTESPLIMKEGNKGRSKYRLSISFNI